MEIFGFFGKYYYILIILQAICVYHCIRKGNQQNWIWLIVFLPAIGCLIYLFSEIITKKDVGTVQENLSSIIVPSGKLKNLQRQLEFSDTFQNRVSLADEYLQLGMTEQAIPLYEESLSGMFRDNPHVIMKLMEAYSQQEKYSRAEELGKRIHRHADFVKSHAHVLYAIALEKGNDFANAESEYLLMKGRFSGFEGRYNYGCFLQRMDRTAESEAIFNGIVQEASHMTPGELRNSKSWVKLSKEALRKKETVA